jgi:putative ABC transport system permease protein
MMRFKIALRNILRNKHRTILNLIMIAGGYTAIVLFQGFAAKLLIDLRYSAINNQYGHLQVAKKNFWEQNASEAAKDRVIENPNEIIEKLKKIPGVEYASGRITFFGLLSTGDQTISAQFVGFDPKVENRMRKGIFIREGKNFTDVDLGTNPVVGGKGIIKMLNGKVGQDLTILSHTFDGVINAIDVNLAGIFVTGLVEIDDTTIYLPLETAQKLLDTSSVERIVTIVNNDDQLPDIRNQVNKIVPQSLHAKIWTELAYLFSQVEDFYAVQNMVIEIIILLLVLLSISNTVGMSIFERTGEIGTLRAMGDKSSDIIKGFCLEGFILGVMGSILGAILAIILSQFTNYLAIPITVPGATIPLPVIIAFLPKAYLISGILLVITTMAATYVPSSKISKMNIVEALRHNI